MSLRIAIVASARYPIREPFAGGLEAHTWSLADGLRRRGHQVSLFAAEGSDPLLQATTLCVANFEPSTAATDDVSMPASSTMREHHAYLDLMLGLAGDGGGRFDVVHNNSLHHLPVAMARAVRTPMVTTLHTPPTPWLESALATGPCPSTFVAVSASTANSWRHVVPGSRVIPNGVDVRRWTPGPGGGPLVWFGRLVPEKAPDLAIAAAQRAGVPLVLCGPVHDEPFFDTEIRPHLSDRVRHVGHLDRTQLVRYVGQASAALVTPRWDEPFGLVAAESLACGTPVLGFDRGGLHEFVSPQVGELVAGGDVTALADAITRRARFDRAAVREHAVGHCSDERMIDEYERLYLELTAVAA